MTTRSDNMITCQDGRLVGYAEYADPVGRPVLYFHGCPGSRFEAMAMDAIAFDLGLRIIAADRPGFGLSDFQPVCPQYVIPLALVALGNGHFI